MSAEATGWVFKNSPYKGAAFAVHLSMADSVNDQNENEFWMSITNLGIKARVARETAARAVSQMVEDGVLELIQDNSNIGRPSRYCFLMPEGVTRDHTPVIRDDTPVTRDHTPVIQDHTNPSRTQVEPKENPKNLSSPSASEPVVERPAAKKKERARNPIWDALVENLRWTPATPSEQSRLGKAVRDLKGIDATPEDIARKCALYRSKYRGLDLTPEALLKHWSSLELQPEPEAEVPDWSKEQSRVLSREEVLASL